MANTESPSTKVQHIHVQERIRWSDMDTAGIMYFGNYTRLFEIAETEFFRAMGFPYSDSQFDRWDAFMLRKTFQLEFHSPVLLDSLVDISLWVEKVGGASLTMKFQVHHESTLTGEGVCTVVLVGRESRRPMRLPEELRVQLEPYLIK